MVFWWRWWLVRTENLPILCGWSDWSTNSATVRLYSRGWGTKIILERLLPKLQLSIIWWMRWLWSRGRGLGWTGSRTTWCRRCRGRSWSWRGRVFPKINWWELLAIEMRVSLFCRKMRRLWRRWCWELICGVYRGWLCIFGWGGVQQLTGYLVYWCSNWHRRWSWARSIFCRFWVLFRTTTTRLVHKFWPLFCKNYHSNYAKRWIRCWW